MSSGLSPRWRVGTGFRPQQLFVWRRQVRDHVPAASFANWATAAEIENLIGMVVIRVRGAADVRMLMFAQSRLA